MKVMKNFGMPTEGNLNEPRVVCICSSRCCPGNFAGSTRHAGFVIVAAGMRRLRHRPSDCSCGTASANTASMCRRAETRHRRGGDHGRCCGPASATTVSRWLYDFWRRRIETVQGHGGKGGSHGSCSSARGWRISGETGS